MSKNKKPVACERQVKKIKKAWLPSVHKVAGTRRGFSMLETMVAVFLFSLAAVLMAGSFSSFLKNFLAVKQIQKNVESSRYAIDLMAKTIRSSTVDPLFASGSSEIRLYDNSEAKCVIFKFNANTIESGNGASTGSDITGCNFGGIATSRITPAGIVSSLRFSGAPTAAAVLGKVTIVTEVFGNNSANNVIIQTTASLRQ